MLSNAVKYSPGQTSIDVCASIQDAPSTGGRGAGRGKVGVFSVTDKGVGISTKEQANIFDRYFRASTSKGIGGTGIGLSVVHDFVMMHHGSIKVESEEGKGSTFTVRIPLDFTKLDNA